MTTDLNFYRIIFADATDPDHPVPIGVLVCAAEDSAQALASLEVAAAVEGVKPGLVELRYLQRQQADGKWRYVLTLT